MRALLDETRGSGEFLFRLCAISSRRDAPLRLCSSFSIDRENVRHIPMPVKIAAPLMDWSNLLAAESVFGRASVYHLGPLMVPFVRRGAAVVTVYDLTPLRFPQFHLASNRFTLERLRKRLQRADVIIVPSRSTAADLEEFAISPRAKVEVIPLGINPVFQPLQEIMTAALRTLGLERDFILAVGSIEPRKNLTRLLHAFGLLRRRHRLPHQLAIVGPEGWMEEDIRRSIVDLHLSEHVLFTGFVPDETLNLLYNAASLLVYPSLYEGFGMPPLEAMAAGCPVAVSRVSSLPEVVGEAGVYFDPLDAEDIGRAMMQILDSEDLRRRLVALGRERSGAFSWRKAALETLAVYRDLCGMPH